MRCGGLQTGSAGYVGLQRTHNALSLTTNNVYSLPVVQNTVYREHRPWHLIGFGLIYPLIPHPGKHHYSDYSQESFFSCLSIDAVSAWEQAPVAG